MLELASHAEAGNDFAGCELGLHCPGAQPRYGPNGPDPLRAAFVRTRTSTVTTFHSRNMPNVTSTAIAIHRLHRLRRPSGSSGGRPGSTGSSSVIRG